VAARGGRCVVIAAAKSGVALVSGAAGFLGSVVVRHLLERGLLVHGVVRASTARWRLDELAGRVVLHEVDLLDAAGVERVVAAVRPEYVVHTAIEGGHPRDAVSRRRSLESGLFATHNLLEASRGVLLRCFVHAGSSLEYGARSEPQREDQRLSPHTFRGAVKAASALLCEQAARGDGLPVVLLRPFSIYGRFEQAERFIPTLVRAVLSGDAMPLTAAGVRHDFVHVDDVARACLLALDRPELAGKTFNVGTGVQTANEEVAGLAKELSGARSELLVGAHGGHAPDTRTWVADTTRARDVLGFTASKSLREGLAETLAWARARRAAGHAW